MTDVRYTKRTIVKEIVESRRLPEGSRSVRIYLPPGYNETLSYPIVYCQDGEDFFNFGRIATTANRLILDEDIEPFIIAGVDVDKRHRTAEYAPDGARHADYVTFFAEEMVPYVESHYPVRRSPEYRLLAGDSLGATASLHTAISYPELFRRIMSLSGAYYPESQRIVAQYADLSALQLYMIVGLQETSFQTDTGVYDFVELNRTTSRLLKERGADVFYEEKDGKHQWGFWQQEIPDALRHFMAG
jgi:enterochelin esterase-like enzyme